MHNKIHWVVYLNEEYNCAYLGELMYSCDEPVENPTEIWTADRLYNTVLQIKTNCVFTHWECNRHRSDNQHLDDNSF